MELGNAPRLTWAETLDWLDGGQFGLNDSGEPAVPLAFVDLDAPDSRAALNRLPALVRAVTTSHRVVIGITEREVPAQLIPLAGALTCTLVGGGPQRLPVTQIAVADLSLACRAIAANVADSPKAAVTLVDLLRLTSASVVPQALVAESLAYSMLLAGPEFACWRAARPHREPKLPPDPPVLVERAGAELRMSLNYPSRHNCFSTPMRDALAEAFDLALRDRTIQAVRMSGRGPSFCSGADLDEFGADHDVSAAHLLRLERGVAGRADRCRDRLWAVVHGACIGAGIEIASFAGRLEARDDTFFQLPGLAMGLVPGTGGTVGITRRIGRWRTAYLALSGIRLHLSTALAWGLVDAHVPD